MVKTGVGDKNIFCQVEHIQIENMKFQEFGYFGLQGIGTVSAAPPIPLVVSDIQKLSKNQQEIQKIHDGVCSYMIDNTIEGSITKI